MPRVRAQINIRGKVQRGNIRWKEQGFLRSLNELDNESTEIQFFSVSISLSKYCLRQQMLIIVAPCRTPTPTPSVQCLYEHC